MDATEAQLRFGASLTHSADTNHQTHTTTPVVNNSMNIQLTFYKIIFLLVFVSIKILALLMCDLDAVTDYPVLLQLVRALLDLLLMWKEVDLDQKGTVCVFANTCFICVPFCNLFRW